MQKTTTPARKGQRFYGYRIQAYRGHAAPSTSLPVIWAATTPKQWEDVALDASVTMAVLYRSGKQIAEFRREQA